jgi:hypothetical protein
VVSCEEAGRDGFWIHRALTARGIANRVVDSASIEVNRRARAGEDRSPRCPQASDGKGKRARRIGIVGGRPHAGDLRDLRGVNRRDWLDPSRSSCPSWQALRAPHGLIRRDLRGLRGEPFVIFVAFVASPS